MKNNFTFIESKDNNSLKLIRKLKQKKFRYKESKFVIESRKMLEEALQSSVIFDFILLREDIVKQVEEGKYDFDFSDLDVKYTNDMLFNEVSDMSTPDGFLAVVKFPQNLSQSSDKILLLDGLQDPGNLGTIIRSCEAFDFPNIFLLNTVDPYNEKTLRASMGSIFRINLHFINDEDLKALHEDYKFYVADMDGVDYRKEQYPGKICLVIGNEANGISDLLLSYAYKRIKIPMSGEIESLNAAISASVIMSEIKK